MLITPAISRALAATRSDDRGSIHVERSPSIETSAARRRAGRARSGSIGVVRRTCVRKCVGREDARLVQRGLDRGRGAPARGREHHPERRERAVAAVAHAGVGVEVAERGALRGRAGVDARRGRAVEAAEASLARERAEIDGARGWTLRVDRVRIAIGRELQAREAEHRRAAAFVADAAVARARDAVLAAGRELTAFGPERRARAVFAPDVGREAPALRCPFDESRFDRSPRTRTPSRASCRPGTARRRRRTRRWSRRGGAGSIDASSRRRSRADTAG